MDSITDRGGSRSGQRAFAFGDADSGLGRPNEVQRNLSADFNPILAPAAVAEQANSAKENIPPVWLQRLGLMLYVLFCMELGMLLIVLPWKPVWKANVFLADFSTMHAVFENYFFRGLVTGLGVVDLCLGVAAAVHYRERRPK